MVNSVQRVPHCKRQRTSQFRLSFTRCHRIAVVLVCVSSLFHSWEIHRNDFPLKGKKTLVDFHQFWSLNSSTRPISISFFMLRPWWSRTPKTNKKDYDTGLAFAIGYLDRKTLNAVMIGRHLMYRVILRPKLKISSFNEQNWSIDKPQRNHEIKRFLSISAFELEVTLENYSINRTRSPQCNEVRIMVWIYVKFRFSDSVAIPCPAYECYNHQIRT